MNHTNGDNRADVLRRHDVAQDVMEVVMCRMKKESFKTSSKPNHCTKWE